MKKSAQGFTLMELLVVVAIIGLLMIPIIMSVRRTGQTQNLRTSVSVLSDDLQTVKVSSREARDKVGWGIVSATATSYKIVKGSKSSPTVVSTKTLQTGSFFVDQFSVWFEIGTGNSALQTIHLQNAIDQKYDIQINELGTISTTQI